MTSSGKHKPGRHNQVTDALSRKVVEEYVAVISTIESNLLDRARENVVGDATYQKLVQQVKDCPQILVGR